MFILIIGIINLSFKSKSFQKWLLSLISFFLILLPFNRAQALETEISLNQRSCENFAISQEIESSYTKIRENLEKDFNSGLPYKLKTQLIGLRSETDTLSQKLFDLANINDQEVNGLVKDTIDRLETFIQLIPAISSNAPKMRRQYVVPFTNISSLKAEHQDCLMTMAIEQAKSQTAENEESIDDNIYTKLTDELNDLNTNLYQAETSDVQKFIRLRAELLIILEDYNKTKTKNIDMAQNVVKTIPKALNAVQSEIEKLLPGLQLSKKYYSIIEL